MCVLNQVNCDHFNFRLISRSCLVHDSLKNTDLKPLVETLSSISAYLYSSNVCKNCFNLAILCCVCTG